MASSFRDRRLKFDGKEEAAPPDIPDGFNALRGAGDHAAQTRLKFLHPLDKLFARDDLLHGDSRSAAGRMAGEGVAGHRPAMHPYDGLRHPVRVDGGAERQVARRQALGHRHDIGFHAIRGRVPPDAAAARAAHHLVRQSQHAISVADLAHPLGIARRCRHPAAGSPHHRLKNKGSNLSGPTAGFCLSSSWAQASPTFPRAPAVADRHWRATAAKPYREAPFKGGRRSRARSRTQTSAPQRIAMPGCVRAR